MVNIKISVFLQTSGNGSSEQILPYDQDEYKESIELKGTDFFFINYCLTCISGFFFLGVSYIWHRYCK